MLSHCVPVEVSTYLSLRIFQFTIITCGFVFVCVHAYEHIHAMGKIQKNKRWWETVYDWKKKEYHADSGIMSTWILLFYLSSYIYLYECKSLYVIYILSAFCSSCLVLKQWIVTEPKQLDYKIFQLSMLWLLISIRTKHWFL